MNGLNVVHLTTATGTYRVLSITEKEILAVSIAGGPIVALTTSRE